MRWRAKRIGVDLDRVSRLRIMQTVFNAQYFFPDKEVEYTETGKGVHIRIYAHSTIQQNLTVRMNLADDQNRLAFDEMRRRHRRLHGWIDTLFTIKMSGGKITREEPFNLMAEPFCSRLPARKPFSRVNQDC